MTRKQAEKIATEAMGRAPIAILGSPGGHWHVRFPSGRKAKVMVWGLLWL